MSRKSLIYRTLSWALQDGLGFKKIKSLETFVKGMDEGPEESIGYATIREN